MTKIVSLNTRVDKQLCRLRTENADMDGKDASYSSIIRMALEESGMWKSTKKKKSTKK
ncbi:MAG: hypothetical protein K8S18_19690 [Desulfobacula sp.]|nr:hypothetical protein [Desulfobacula sp.]